MKPWRVWKHTNHTWKKPVAAALAATVLLSGAPCGMQRAEAGWDGWDDVIEAVGGTLIALLQRTQLLDLGDNPAVQAELCSQAEKENDGRPDRRAVILTDSVMTRLIEQAYADDARTGARETFLTDEREHEADVEKERAKQAAAAEASPKKAANGDMYLELGLTNFAEKEYARAKALDEENPDAACGLAMVEGRRGHHEQALAMVDEVLAKHAGNAHALVARAKALEAYRAYHEAAPEACDIPADYMTMLVDGITQDGEGR